MTVLLKQINDMLSNSFGGMTKVECLNEDLINKDGRTGANFSIEGVKVFLGGDMMLDMLVSPGLVDDVVYKTLMEKYGSIEEYQAYIMAKFRKQKMNTIINGKK